VSDSSASASLTSFESAQHGYELELPDGWQFVDGAGT
jgi:hypothetical protein